MSDWKDELKAEQGSLSKEEVFDLMKERSEFLADLDNLKPQQHRWVDRGKLMSCEGAGHAYHQASKR